MLEIKNLCFRVDTENGPREIIHDLSLVIEDDKFVVITGPNGSGKSTLARLIMGIEKPTFGTILYNGVDITNAPIDERARMGLSFALQQPVRFKGITVFDLIKLAAGTKMTTSEACKYLSAVGLCARDYIDREVNSNLSGGELKRIEIAGILARNTKFSVFDEPEAGIDLWSFQNLIKVFENMRSQTRGSILIISHQERILNIADEVVLLSAGQIIKKGPKDEILPTLLGTSAAVDMCSGIPGGI